MAYQAIQELNSRPIEGSPLSYALDTSYRGASAEFFRNRRLVSAVPLQHKHAVLGVHKMEVSQIAVEVHQPIHYGRNRQVRTACQGQGYSRGT